MGEIRRFRKEQQGRLEALARIRETRQLVLGGVQELVEQIEAFDEGSMLHAEDMAQLLAAGELIEEATGRYVTDEVRYQIIAEDQNTPE